MNSDDSNSDSDESSDEEHEKNHVPNGNGRGAGSHKGIVFKDNPGKKLRSHANSKPHKDVIESLTQL